MRTRIVASLLVTSATLAAILIASWDPADSNKAVQPKHNVTPIGRQMTDKQRQLPAKAMRLLEANFPNYRLPLDQDRLCDQTRAAIESDNHEQFDQLFNAGVDVNWRESVHLPLLFVAIRENRPAMVKKLIAHGAEVSIDRDLGYPHNHRAVNAWGQTPLYFAARLGHLEIVKMLVRAGADVDSKNRSGKSPIIAAVEAADVDVFHWLLEQGASPDFGRQFYADRFLNQESVTNDTELATELPISQPNERPVATLLELANRTGNQQIIDELRRRHKDWLTNQDQPSTVPMYAAVLRGDTATVRELIARGELPTHIEHDWNLLHFAAKNGAAEICTLLIDAGIDPNDLTGGQGPIPPLQLAVQSGSVATFNALVDHGANFVRDETLVRVAVSSRKPEMIEHLIGQGDLPTDPQLLVTFLSTAMPGKLVKPGSEQSAIDLKIAKRLIDRIGISSQDQTKTLARIAAERGRVDLFQLIVENGNVSFSDPLLRIAIASGNVQLCRIMIAKGAKLIPDTKTDSMLLRQVMASHRDPELTDLMFELGIEKVYPNQLDNSGGYASFHEYGHPLYHAALVGDNDYCRYLIRNFPASELWQPLHDEPYEYDPDIEYFQQGNTPLFAAVFGDHWTTVQLFLTHRFPNSAGEELLDIDAANAIGATALHEAVNYGAPRSVQLLLASGASALLHRDHGEHGDGNTPLHLAIHNRMAPHTSPHGRIEPDAPRIFPMLASVAESQNPGWLEVTNRRRQTILHQHAYAGHLQICQSLVRLGANLNALDQDNATPLHLAIRGNSPHHPKRDQDQRFQLCKFLAENGTELRQVDAPPYLTYFAAAATNHLFEFCDYLTEQGIEPDVERYAGPMLCAAAGQSQPALLLMLLDKGATLDATDYQQKTALHHAVEARDLSMCKLLIDRGTNVNAQDRDGRTPLFSVFDRFAVHVERFIVADPEATEKQLLPILRLLLDSGADVSIRNTDNKTVLDAYPPMPQAFRTMIETSL